MQKQLKKTVLNPSAEQLDRIKANSIEQLVTLYEKKYLLRRGRVLHNELFRFIYSKPDTHFQSLDLHMKLIRLLFKEEYWFTKEAFAEISLLSETPLADHDFLRLLEAVLCTNWEYFGQTEALLSYIELIDSLLKIICRQLKVSEQFFEANRTSFLHHIKFLAFRIQKKEVDYSTSDNDIYFLIKENHFEAFEIAASIRKFITETYDFDLSNNDVTYLALHIVKALDSLSAA